jgi:hypothetical protein
MSTCTVGQRALTKVVQRPLSSENNEDLDLLAPNFDDRPPMAPKTNGSEEISNTVDFLVMPTRGNQASKGENAEQPKEPFIADLVVASSGDTNHSVF